MSSEPNFFRSGCTIAVFHSSVKMSCVNEILIILVVVCTILGVISLSTDVGIASSLHDLVAIVLCRAVRGEKLKILFYLVLVV